MFAGSGGGYDTEGGWAMPDIVVTIRKLGEEPQTAVIREVMLVSANTLLKLRNHYQMFAFIGDQIGQNSSEIFL